MKKRVLVVMIIFGILLLSGCTDSDNAANNDANVSGNQIEMSILSGYVFLDTNENGIRDADEEGIEGIVINGNQSSATTNSNGEFELNVEDGDEKIKVDQSSVSSDFELTTGNDEQTITINSSEVQAKPIGYSQKLDSVTSGLNFFDSIDRDSTYNNYYFELLINDGSGYGRSMKYWVIDESIKSEAEGMVIYSNKENGTMGVYTAETNQVVVTPYMEMEDILTPFTFMEDLDPDTFTTTMYKGEENLDGKAVLVFESNAGGITATYYIWKDHKLIIKMDTKMNEAIGGFYFKDLTFDRVTIDEITYPEGAEVLDMGSM